MASKRGVGESGPCAGAISNGASMSGECFLRGHALCSGEQKRLFGRTEKARARRSVRSRHPFERHRRSAESKGPHPSSGEPAMDRAFRTEVFVGPISGGTEFGIESVNSSGSERAASQRADSERSPVERGIPSHPFEVVHAGRSGTHVPARGSWVVRGATPRGGGAGRGKTRMVGTPDRRSTGARSPGSLPKSEEGYRRPQGGSRRPIRPDVLERGSGGSDRGPPGFPPWRVRVPIARGRTGYRGSTGRLPAPRDLERWVCAS